MRDYYAILGVTPSAEPDELSRAFRAKVKQCHPDRGGSHAEMVLVNEAWEVLSNAELKRHYDEARQYADDRAKQATAMADAQEARQAAEQYPKTWAEAESWLDGLVADFANAQYRSRTTWWGIDFPVATKSVSAIVFIIGGAIVGLLPVIAMIGAMLHFEIRGNPAVGTVCVALIAGGAWAGAALHNWFGRNMANAHSTRRPTDGSGFEHGSDARRNRSTASSFRQAADARVVVCGRCGQKLRVPAAGTELIITCGRCRYKFTFSA